MTALAVEDLFSKRRKMLQEFGSLKTSFFYIREKSGQRSMSFHLETSRTILVESIFRST